VKLLSSFIRDTSASSAVVFSVALLPMTVAAGGAVDFTRAYTAQTLLQTQTDAAALRVALMGPLVTPDQRVAAARTLFTDGRTSAADVAVTWDGVTTTVTASAQTPTTILNVAGMKAIPTKAKASAETVRSGPVACILALNPTANGAILIAGSASLVADGCALYSNSSSPSAISVQGSAVVQALGFCSVGGFSGAANTTPTPLTGCSSVTDPFAALQRPSSSGCSYNNLQVQPSQTKSLTPGTFCGGLTIKGTATLDSGVYIVKDGPLSIASQANVSGTGVTFLLTGSGASFSISAGGAISLTAPSSGTYSGMLIMQDKESNVGAGDTLNGGGNMTLTGAIYLPTQTLTINGGSGFGQTSTFMPIIADQVKFAGSTTPRADLQTMRTAQPLTQVKNGARLTQ
jgi:hypothetical protein